MKHTKSSKSVQPEKPRCKRQHRPTEKSHPEAFASVGQDAEPLSKAELRELKQRIRDIKDPVRYMLVSEFSRRFILYYDVSSDTFVMNEPSRGTLFKRLQVARAVKRHLGRGIFIVTFTIKGGGLKRLTPYQGRVNTKR